MKVNAIKLLGAIGFILGASGTLIILGFASWQVMVGVILFTWGDNLLVRYQLKKDKELIELRITASLLRLIHDGLKEKREKNPYMQ